MAFRDDISGDVTDVFLNPDEFAEEHTWNGSPLVAVVTEIGDALDSGSTQEGFMDAQTLALITGRVALYCDIAAITPPIPNERIELDGHRFLVDNVSASMGMYKITLTRAYS